MVEELSRSVIGNQAWSHFDMAPGLNWCQHHHYYLWWYIPVHGGVSISLSWCYLIQLLHPVSWKYGISQPGGMSHRFDRAVKLVLYTTWIDQQQPLWLLETDSTKCFLLQAIYFVVVVNTVHNSQIILWIYLKNTWCKSVTITDYDGPWEISSVLLLR